MTEAQQLLEEARQQEPSGQMADRLWKARVKVQQSPAFDTREGLELHRALHEEWMRHRY